MKHLFDDLVKNRGPVLKHYPNPVWNVCNEISRKVEAAADRVFDLQKKNSTQVLSFKWKTGPNVTRKPAGFTSNPFKVQSIKAAIRGQHLLVVLDLHCSATFTMVKK